MTKEIRPLRADEIEVRVDQVYKDNNNQPIRGRYLLYKDARCDMRILNETFGIFGWQREHRELNGVIYCGVSVKNEVTGEWITKWDCGSESSVEKEKGASSDSFKRACVNWTIGNELYSAPQISIEYTDYEKQHNGIIYGLHVHEIAYESGKITKLVIADGRGYIRYSTTTAVKAAPVAQSVPDASVAPSVSAPLVQQAGQVICAAPAPAPQLYPAPAEIVTSKKIKIVTDFLNKSGVALDYYESKLGQKRARWSVDSYTAVYDSLLKSHKIEAIQ